jgi:hypothetical protein
MHSEHAPSFDFPAGPLPTTVTKAEFARLIGVTPGRVSQLIKIGLPVEPNGRIHLEKGREWVRENVDAARRRSLLEAGEPAGGLAANPRAVRAIAEAKLASLKADRLEKSLINRAATLRAIEARARQERDAWLGWVHRAAPELARLQAGDLNAFVATLDRLVREQLAMLADMPPEVAPADIPAGSPPPNEP